MGQSPADRITEIFRTCAPRVFAYASRHCTPDAAQEVVSETFLVAWRRIAEVPDEPLPWLLVVARNTIANHRRTRQRGARLVDAVAGLERLASPAGGSDEAIAERDAMLRVLADLTSVEREALLLVAWDGLTPNDAAAVAGCSRTAFQVRLHRARARVKRLLDTAAPGMTTEQSRLSTEVAP